MSSVFLIKNINFIKISKFSRKNEFTKNEIHVLERRFLKSIFGSIL